MNTRPTKDEIETIEARRGSFEKYDLKRVQRIYLKYNPEAEKSCLCTKVLRKIWIDIFFNWFDSVK
jgi:hypothetical protein